MRVARTFTVIGALLVFALPAAAQDWPARTLSLVVPYGAGGPADVIARILAPPMSDVLGQSVIVENIPGAGGMTGAARVARASPDGYQFLMGAAGVLSQNQTLYKHPLYNSLTDFAPVGLIAIAPPILVTRKDFPADNLAEFIAYARAHRGPLQFGSSGAGSGGHVTCLLLNTAIGAEFTHVPYRSAAAVYQDLIAGRLDYMCDFISTALPQIKGRSVKAIATLTRERTPLLPELATAHEQGLAGFDTPGWYALVAPAKTPDAVVRRLSKAMSDALDNPAAGERFTTLGNTVAPAAQRTPEYLGGFIRSEIDKWAGPIKASGMSLD